ncbi:hypothetical protein [Vibrio phage VP4B]|uniref:Uncharacterized protein n=1 Tax=Vibrio phage VP4B TaxID=1262540 RepID=V9LZI6_9CAUD|nr:internal head protein [Vibrio phage VP4B]AGB07234.1 hypothetical protein [Vibrio phage VP4B]
MKNNVTQALRILAGMESAPVELDLEQQTVLVEEVETVRAENEANEVASEITAMVKESDQRVEHETELEQVVDGLEFLKQNPNPQAMVLLYDRADRLHVKLGGQTTKPRAGLESIDTRTLDAHVIVGCESFMDTLKQGADNTLQFLKSIWKRLVEYFKAKFSETGKMKKRAEELKKKLQDGAELKDDPKAGPWYQFLEYAKKGCGAFAGSITSMIEIIGLLNNGTGEQVIKTAPILHSMCEDIRKGSPSGASIKKNGIWTVNADEGALVIYPEKVPTNADDAVEFFTKVRMELKKFEAPKTQPVLKQGDRSNLISTCEVVLSNLEEIGVLQKKIENQEKSLETSLKDIDKAEARLIRAQNNAIVRLSTSSLNMRIRSSKALLEMVSAYIK